MLFFSSIRRHTILQGDWSSDVCSSDLTCGRNFAAMSGGVAVKRSKLWPGFLAVRFWQFGILLLASPCEFRPCHQRKRRSEERRVGKEGKSWRAGNTWQ